MTLTQPLPLGRGKTDDVGANRIRPDEERQCSSQATYVASSSSVSPLNLIRWLAFPNRYAVSHQGERRPPLRQC